MTIIFFVILTFLIIAFIFVSIFLVFKTKQEKQDSAVIFANKIFEEKGFVPLHIIYINSAKIAAINAKQTVVAVITINSPDNYTYEEINYFLITSIEKTPVSINLTYISNGDKKVLTFNRTKQVEDIIYRLYKNATVRKLSQKYNIKTFSITSGSDWNCSFVWAYFAQRALFTYHRNTEKTASYKLNLLKEFFTLDTKYSYFEAPVLGIAQQLFVYEKSFLDELYNYLVTAIKQKTATVVTDKIFYDDYSNIIYLSNGVNSLQSIIIDKIDDVYYHDNKLTFTLKEDEREINFLADKNFIEEFVDFITKYNLGKIAHNFNYNFDKIMNATDSTKFIIDYTRDRVIYCANFDRFSKFSYIIIAFSSLESAELVKSGTNYFVRIFTKDKDIIDISCKKPKVAQYIMAQLTTIINS